MTRQLPFVDEIVDALEDVGFMVKVMYPYVIVLNFKNRQITAREVSWALDIDQELCARSVSGDIRIRCD